MNDVRCEILERSQQRQQSSAEVRELREQLKQQPTSNSGSNTAVEDDTGVLTQAHDVQQAPKLDDLQSTYHTRRKKILLSSSS